MNEIRGNELHLHISLFCFVFLKKVKYKNPATEQDCQMIRVVWLTWWSFYLVVPPLLAIAEDPAQDILTEN